MANRPLPPIDVLRQLVAYDPESGAITYLARGVEMFPSATNPSVCAALWNARHAGTQAQYVGNQGYIIVRLYKRHMAAHRVAWALHHGAWPSDGIDHINGIRSDNRIGNLREATISENSKNRRIPIDNTSGIVGVSWHKPAKRWIAKITANGVYHHLGYFDTIEEAASVRKSAEDALGFHPNNGGPRKVTYKN